MVTVQCRQCGNKFDAYPSRVKNRAKFCRPRCYADWLSANRSGAKHHMYGRRHSRASIAKMSRSQKERAATGPASAAWKGGKHISRGYVMVAMTLLSETERRLFEPMAKASSNRCIPEHRLVMARILGRPLLASEVVHHRNGNKQDNRPRNLEMHDNATHKREHQAIVRELRRLRRENEVLKSQLSKCLSVTSRSLG